MPRVKHAVHKCHQHCVSSSVHESYWCIRLVHLCCIFASSTCMATPCVHCVLLRSLHKLSQRHTTLMHIDQPHPVLRFSPISCSSLLLTHYLVQIRTIERVCEIPHEGPFCDLMWSDPEETETWAISPRGAGWLFGARVAAEFNQINGLELICRAHQLVQEGLKYMFPPVSRYSSLTQAGRISCTAGAMLYLFIHHNMFKPHFAMSANHQMIPQHAVGRPLILRLHLNPSNNTQCPAAQCASAAQPGFFNT